MQVLYIVITCPAQGRLRRQVNAQVMPLSDGCQMATRLSVFLSSPGLDYPRITPTTSSRDDAVDDMEVNIGPLFSHHTTAPGLSLPRLTSTTPYEYGIELRHSHCEREAYTLPTRPSESAILGYRVVSKKSQSHDHPSQRQTGNHHTQKNPHQYCISRRWKAKM
ncbi:hypothetical protein VTG60DRAFT_4297 [Thermothelomyces hinnuleus]